MKKLLTILALSIFVLAFTSCKKDFTCECTVDGDTQNVEYKSVKKSDAKKSCEEVETTWKGLGAEASCNLK